MQRGTLFFLLAACAGALTATYTALSARIKEDPAWVLTARIALGEDAALTPELLEIRKMPRAYTPREVLEAPAPFNAESLRGWRTRIAVPAGEPLTVPVIRPEAALPQGRSSPVWIPVECRTLNILRPGDRINIGLLHDTGKPGSARPRKASTTLEKIPVQEIERSETACRVKVALSSAEAAFLEAALKTEEIFIGLDSGRP